jgi:hypothetical protein
MNSYTCTKGKNKIDFCFSGFDFFLFDLKKVKKRKKERKMIKLKETLNILLGKVKKNPQKKILKK